MLLCTLPWGAAQALIDISPKIMAMDSEHTTVQVSNTGDTPEFVEITLYQVANPGVPPEEEQLIPLGIVKDPYLYATPFKLSLGPRQQKPVQLKALKIPEQEKVYRLAVIPQQNARIQGTQDNVMLLNLGFKGLIRQLPAAQTATWQHRCTAGGLQLEATGTVRVGFSGLQQNNQSVEDFNVYPGTPRQIAAQHLAGQVEGKPFRLQCVR
ncbi:hypothetical protein Z042_16665 [Chania multitudinisentens RB-25]|uniref:Pilus assembly protein n=1 Tax=Chania multitudinisentens RB-25 TaxID=1441930 RepID=W0LB25_9GAMM|nr:hypothetical protein Z042_16665 [Chania multitudinisentens RB-25]